NFSKIVTCALPSWGTIDRSFCGGYAVGTTIMARAQFGALLQQLHKLMAAPLGGELTDGQLLERFVVRHEEAAFECLVRRHGALVLRVCRRVLNDSHEADDAFQATFLVLVRKAGSIMKRESVGSWLHGVAYRISRKARATAARRQVCERL